MRCANTYFLNKHIDDLDEQECRQEAIEKLALTICDALKTEKGFQVGRTHYYFSDSLIHDDKIDDELLKCLVNNDFSKMSEYLNDAVYKYAVSLAEEFIDYA